MIRNFAMTPEEMEKVHALPPGPAWMSCHFSESGLQDLPETLPEDALLILDDSLPLGDVPCEKVLSDLSETIGKLHLQALLLDFQRPGNKRVPELAGLLSRALPCPVGISEVYGKATEGPVFLPLLPAHRSLSDWAAPWKGRELWLEVGPAFESARVTETGTVFEKPSFPLPSCPHSHEKLHCHYGMEIGEKEVVFTLYRTPQDLKALTEEAAHLGFTRTIGLYQELF